MQESPASTPEKIVVEGRLSGFEPDELFTYWVEPLKLVQWWPAMAETHPEVGGTYSFSWPEMDWHVRGKYTVVEPGKRLGFTWKWDHDPSDALPKDVLVHFEPHLDGGTIMTIEHEKYLPEEQDDRQGAVEGWLHFGMKLAGLKESSA